MKRLAYPLVMLLALIWGAGCATSHAKARTLTIFAAASLTEAFQQLAVEYRESGASVELAFSFAGSSSLARQIISGARPDVFAAASPSTMATVTGSGLAAAPPVTFAKNQLVIAVPRDNPHDVRALDGLARPGMKVALCAPTVPCGAAADQALAAAKVTFTPVSLEQDVRAALTKVRLGEVDAALVYRSDIRAAGNGIIGIDFPESARAVNDYQAVVLKGSASADDAERFLAFLRSERARSLLLAAGFQVP